MNEWPKMSLKIKIKIKYKNILSFYKDITDNPFDPSLMCGGIN